MGCSSTPNLCRSRNWREVAKNAARLADLYEKAGDAKGERDVVTGDDDPCDPDPYQCPAGGDEQCCLTARVQQLIALNECLGIEDEQDRKACCALANEGYAKAWPACAPV